MRKQLLTALLALLATATFAQKKIAGYVITLQHDTLRGNIVDKGNFRNAHSIAFTAGNASQSKTYTPEELSGFVIGKDRVYESLDLTASFVGAKLFAKRVLDSYVSLYATIPHQDTAVYLLRKRDGSVIPLEEKNYFGLLKFNLSDCPKIRFDEKDLQIYRYREANLVALLSRYNTCVSPQTPQNKTKNEFPVSYGILLGASLNHYQSLNAVTAGDYGQHASPNAGAFLGFSASRTVEVEAQLLYNHVSGRILKTSSTLYGDETYQFSIHYLTAPLLFRYFLFDKLYVSPGIIINKAISQSGTHHIYDKDFPFTAHPSTFSLGYMAGIGTKFRLLNKVTLLEARYHITNIRTGVYPEANTSSIQLLLRMNLAKR